MQVFVNRDVLFVKLKGSKIELEPEPPINPFSFKSDQLKASALAKQIISALVKSDYRCIRALARAESSIRLEMESCARQSTLDELFKEITHLLLGSSVVKISV